ncbi:MAG TPA: hypothetical protein VED22_02040 [Nitrososphaerales archaeon]|nr:hypothetical protein [Nitrososphaerales archaeon]
MVELVEYAVAFMVSALLVGGSVVLYNSFASYEAGLQLRGTFSVVAGVADSALLNGSAATTIPLPASTIGCEGGTFYVSEGSETISQTIGSGCNFLATVSAGTHVLSFSTTSGRLEMVVK